MLGGLRLRARLYLVHVHHQLFGHGTLDFLLGMIELLLAFELFDSVFEQLYCLFAFINLLLIVRLARVKQRVLEQIKHLVDFLVHFD